MSVTPRDVTALSDRVATQEGMWNLDPANLAALLTGLQTRVAAIEGRTDSPGQIQADLDAIAVRIAALEAKLPAVVA